MRKIPLLGLILFLAAACTGTEPPPVQEPFPPLFTDRAVFGTAIGACREEPLTQKISGVTVPHHLLAADLIAEAFSKLKGQDYRRLVILSPDHFNRSVTPFAVTRRDFATVPGRVAIDQAAVDLLLKNPLVSESSLFSQEHGIQALLPFVAHYCPQAQIVPLAIRRRSDPAEWDSLAESLAPLLGPGTLVVQSTDFSHYLPPKEARRRDQDILRVLSLGDPKGVLALTEPAHLDSRACQYLQLRLQRKVFRAGPTVLANRNSQEYTAAPLVKTTSYIVQLYSAEPLGLDSTKSYFFGGDTFFGRGVAKRLAYPERRQALVQQVREITRGRPLVANLEGVLTGKPPDPVGPYTLWMEDALSLPILKDLNIRAVSLANNHSLDLGEEPYREMVRSLSQQGIACLEQGRVLDLGDFYLAGFTDLNNQSEAKAGRLTREDLKCLGQVKKDKPLFAFLHWGLEFARQAGPREESLAGLLEDMGVEVVIGCHAHRAGSLEGNRKSCRVFSLGNFIFDQDRTRTSGILLEAVFFPQGTYFLRVHPVDPLISGTR
jgi:AmmeMemoRadiSam system protein B